MGKLLTAQEAEDIINTMLDEYSLTRIKVVWKKASDGRNWSTPDLVIKERRFLWWKWQSQKLEGNWVRASSLIKLVQAAEDNIQDYDGAAEETAQIRERHAQRLINKKLQE